jgi:hypothetical protein
MAKRGRAFNPKTFLSTVGVGRKMMFFRRGQTIYSQGDRSDAQAASGDYLIDFELRGEGEVVKVSVTYHSCIERGLTHRTRTPSGMTGDVDGTIFFPTKLLCLVDASLHSTGRYSSFVTKARIAVQNWPGNLVG